MHVLFVRKLRAMHKKPGAQFRHQILQARPTNGGDYYMMTAVEASDENGESLQAAPYQGKCGGVFHEIQ